MFDPQIMYDLINSYDEILKKAKAIRLELKNVTSVTAEIAEAQKMMENAVNTMVSAEEQLFQVKLLCEIDEAKRNGFNEIVEELKEELKEF